jgi:signal peptidase I
METAVKEARSPSLLQRVTIGRNPVATLVRLAVLIVCCVVIFKFMLLPVRIQGVSMLPTYPEGGRINFVNRLSYLFHGPGRGDIVAIRTTGIHIMYMKRIIGLPGESVGFYAGKAVINGEELDEPYVKKSCYWQIPPRTLGPGEYYVVGDNRSMPEADHEKGIASRDRIVGKVLW